MNTTSLDNKQMQYSAQINTIQIKYVSRLRLYKIIALKYYVENKALFETWK